MSVAENVFVDTNVLLRATISTMPSHQEAAALIDAQLDRGVALWINRQVIREFLVVVTRPQSLVAPLPFPEIALRVGALETTFRIAEDNADVTAQLMALLAAYPTGGKQDHDANIVATMLVYGIPTLLTQNVADMKRFSDRTTIVPLLPASPSPQ